MYTLYYGDIILIWLTFYFLIRNKTHQFIDLTQFVY